MNNSVKNRLSEGMKKLNLIGTGQLPSFICFRLLLASLIPVISAQEIDTLKLHIDSTAKIHKSAKSLFPPMGAHMDSLQWELDSNRLDAAHLHIHHMEIILGVLKPLTEALEPKEKRKRIQGYLKNLGKLCEAIHLQAHKNNRERCLKFSNKLAEQWKLFLDHFSSS